MFVAFVRVLIAAQNDIEAARPDTKIPIITHCSAGIGRTGVFIVVFSVLHALTQGRDVRDVEVMSIVRNIRRQRRYMVQTIDQYTFVYHALVLALPKLRSSALGAKENPVALRRQPIAAPLSKIRRRPSSIVRTAAATALKNYRASVTEEAVEGDVEYGDLVSIVTEPSLLATKALISSLNRADLDSITQILFKIFGTSGTLVPFVLRVAKWEIDDCDSAKLLFRGNSFATKVIGASFNLYGSKYLISVIRPLIQKMLDTPKMSYEINPHQLGKGENLGENRAVCRRVAEQFFSAILASENEVPLAMRLICHGIAKCTGDKFPDAVNTAVGGALFLRFYAPFIISPESSSGVLDADQELTPEIKRGLLMISKMIQHIANLNPSSGFREEHMQVMNTFVQLAVPRVDAFLTKISQPPSLLDPDTLDKCVYYQFPLSCRPGTSSDLSIAGPNRNGVVSDGVDIHDLILLHQFFSDHSSDVARILTNFGESFQAAKLLALLQKIGPSGSPTILPPSVWRVTGFLQQDESEKIARNRESVRRMSMSGKQQLKTVIQEMKNIEETAAQLVQAPKQARPPEYVKYPNSDIIAGQVNSLSWDVIDRGRLRCLFASHRNNIVYFSEYDPADYTAPEVLAMPDWADPDPRLEHAVLLFNGLDTKSGVDRRSFEGKYKVISGLPRNPKQRTGITGRGALGRWGPNHTADAIITRFQRDGTGEIIVRCGRPVVEFLVFQQPDGSVC